MIGVGVMVLAVAVVAYLLATPLTSTNQPNLVAAVRGSKVLSQVDEVAPPWLKAVPNRLKALLDTSGLPEVLRPFGRTPIANVDAPDAALIRRSRRRSRAAERHEDPWRGTGLPKGLGGNGFRRRAEPGDVQRARRRRRRRP